MISLCIVHTKLTKQTTYIIIIIYIDLIISASGVAGIIHTNNPKAMINHE